MASTDQIAELDRKIASAPRNVSLLYQRAVALKDAGRNHEAVDDLIKLLGQEPDHPSANALIFDITGKAYNPEEVKRGLAVFTVAEVPKTTFADVAGMEDLKEELRKSIVYPLQHPELSLEYGVKGGGGVLLYGPPGCGKTYIVKATAGEAKVNFIEVSTGDLVDMYAGNTEKNVHNVFELGRRRAPALMFFDEMDSLGGKRETLASGSPQYRQAVNALLTEMDGISSSNENILIVGATNSPWLIDTALKRSGRFGKVIYVPPPDEQARADLFRQYLKGKPVGEDVNFEELATATELFSAADIAAVSMEAAKIPWEEALKTGKKRAISTEDIIFCAKKTIPTIPEWFNNAVKYGWAGQVTSF